MKYLLLIISLFIYSNSTTSQTIIINEIDTDQTGSDTAEFIELYDGGIGNTSLNGMILAFINGDNKQVYFKIDLSNYNTNSEGYLVAGNQSITNRSHTFSDGKLQNGPDAVALYKCKSSDIPLDAVYILDNLIDAIVYGTSQSIHQDLLPLLNAGQLIVNENMNNLITTQSLQRIPNGSGGALNSNTYNAETPTPGYSNSISTNLENSKLNLSNTIYVSKNFLQIPDKAVKSFTISNIHGLIIYSGLNNQAINIGFIQRGIYLIETKNQDGLIRIQKLLIN